MCKHKSNAHRTDAGTDCVALGAMTSAEWWTETTLLHSVHSALKLYWKTLQTHPLAAGKTTPNTEH